MTPSMFPLKKQKTRWTNKQQQQTNKQKQNKTHFMTQTTHFDSINERDALHTFNDKFWRNKQRIHGI